MNRNTLRRALVAATSAAAAMALLAGCASGTSAAKAGSDGLIAVKINQAVPTLVYLPLYVAEAQGYFKDNGVKVSIDSGGSGTASFAAVLGGSADFSIQDPVFVAKSQQSGGEGVVVASVHEAPSEYLLGKDSTSLIGNLKYLEGKKVIVSPEPDSTWAFMTYLIKQNNLKNVKLINVSLGNELAAVASGQADYAVVAEPQATQGIHEQGLTDVYSFADEKSWKPFAFSSLTSTQKYLDANPKATQGVVNAFEEADRFIYSNPEETIAIAQKQFPDLKKEYVAEAVKRMSDGDGYPHHALVSEESWAGNMKIAAFIKNVDGYPTDATKYSNDVNTTFAEKAEKTVDSK